MVNTQYLEEEILKSGKKKTYLAERCGITRQSLTNKINNRTEFTLSQVKILCDELGISQLTKQERIFFARKV